MRIHKGDSVVVITGDDAGEVPRKVVEVIDKGEKLVVEGVARVFKHVKRGHPKSPQGGRLQLEMPIAASNVMLYCTACNKPTRVGRRYLDDGRKIRFCRKCNAQIGSPLSPPNPKYAKAGK